MKDHAQKNKEKDHLARLKKQHRKQFFANLKVVCNLLAGYDLHSKFPLTFLEKIYAKRIHQVKVIAGDSSITRKELKEWDEDIKRFLEISYLDLPNGKDQVALSLMLIEVQSLTFWAKELTDDEFPAARETRETLKCYLEPDFDRRFSAKLEDLLFMLGLFESQVDHHFIWAHFDAVPTKTKTSFHHTFYLYKVASIKENFKIEGHVRPAYRVGWAFYSYGIEWSEIKPGLNRLTTNAPLPVFIQHHALQRLDERMGLLPGLLQYALFDSIRNLSYQVDEKGNVLIDFIYRKLKTGYLAASVVNNRLLIHTFLFITNNGTPEGKKLSKLTGMQAMDKKFLAIDKLSTFLSYKINDNAFVKKIFVKAGCGHLLEIKDLEHFLFNPGKEINAETIANYLKANRGRH